MPFVPINFASIPPQGNPFMANLVDTLVKGYQAGQLPKITKLSERSQEIQNALQQMLAQEQPEKFASDMKTAATARDYTGAMANNVNTMTPLAAALQKMLVQEQPQKFASDMSTAATARDYTGAMANNVNTMTPLAAAVQQMSVDPDMKADFTNRLIQRIRSQAQNYGSQNYNNNVSAVPPEMARETEKYTANPSLMPPLPLRGATPKFNGPLTIDQDGINKLRNFISNQKVPDQSAQQGQLNTQQDPLIEAIIRKQLGLPSQTPNEKIQNQIDVFNKKQQIKQTPDNLSMATITNNQRSIQAINNVLPLIDELKNFHVPNQFIGKYLNPNDQATYQAKMASIADQLVSAMQLPKTDSSLNLVKTMVGKAPLETDSNYVKRLSNLSNDLIDRKERARLALKGSGTGADINKNKNKVFNLLKGGWE